MFSSRLFWSAWLIQLMMTPAMLAISYGLIVNFDRYVPWHYILAAEVLVVAVIAFVLLRGWFSLVRAFLITWGLLATTTISSCLVVMLSVYEGVTPFGFEWIGAVVTLIIPASLPMPIVFYMLRQAQRLDSSVMLPPDP